MVTACATFNRRDLAVVKTQVHSTDHLPDRACTVILLDQLFNVDRAQNELIAIN